jgi:GxxExxY protein
MLVDEGLTRIVIGCAHRVHNVLGPGLPESVYVGALAIECQKQGLHVSREFPIAVYYDGVVVGSYRADLLIERRLIVEAKACPFHESHGKQVLTYLRCSDVELGIVISFDPKPYVRRFIMRNAVKEAWRKDRDRQVGAEMAAAPAESTLK